MAVHDDIDNLINEGELIFRESLQKSDDKLAQQIIKIYSQFVEDNNLVLDVQQLAQLEETIIEAVKKTGYKSGVDKFIMNFDELNDLNRQLHEQINEININKLLKENDKINNFSSLVESQLRGTPSTMVQVTDVIDGETVVRKVPIRNPSLDELIQPIAEQIRKDVILGVSFDSATESILTAIEKKQLGLSRWAGQIARDSLNQADGLVQDEVRKEYDLQNLTYVGAIRGTTRPVCFHLRSDLKGKVTEEQLEEVLNTYIPEGVPSTTRITYAPLGKPRTAERGAGMIPGTLLSNFTIYRGGYNCHHRAVWTKK